MNDMTPKAGAETRKAERAGPESGRAGTGPEQNRDLEGLSKAAKILALYVSRHGDVLPEDSHTLHEEPLEAIAKTIDDSSTSEWNELMVAYFRETALTYEASANQIPSNTNGS